MEEWKNVNHPDYKDLYEVSTLGQVRRIETKHVLKPHLRNGYYSLGLCKPGMKKNKYIHSLVASTFIENPNKCPIVNHKNGIRTDNQVSNLEWCTYKQNRNHALSTKLTKPATKKVNRYSYDGTTFIDTFDSIIEAERKTGVGNRLITQVCRGQKPTAHGWVWRYTDGFQKVEKDEVNGKPIPNFPNYLITADAKVYSIRYKRYLVQNKTTDYNSVTLCNNTVQLNTRIHILVANAFIPNPNNYPEVNHINSDKRDNRQENLEWVTASQNMKKHHVKKKLTKKAQISSPKKAQINSPIKTL